MNKKGLSMIVSTLIIILLVLVAVGVIWAVVNKILTEGSDKIALDKFFIDLKVKNAYAAGSDMIVQVKRGVGEGDLAGMTFVFSDGENTEVQSITDTLDELETGTFTFTLENLGTATIESVSVAPIYLAPSGGEVLGEITNTNELSDEDLEGGSDIPGGGDGDPGCTLEDCVSLGNYECGTWDDGCGDTVECGDCVSLYGAGYECGQDEGICYDASCVPDPDPCITEAAQCGEVNDGCGTMVACADTCTALQECTENLCVDLLALNIGTIANAWPPGTGLFFDSLDLPIDEYFVNSWAGFSTVDTSQCYHVVGYTIPEPGVYDKVIVELGGILESLNIGVGDPYEIWETQLECATSIAP